MSTDDTVGKPGEKPLDCRLTGPGRVPDRQTRSILDRLLGMRRDDHDDVHVMRCGPFLRGRHHGRELDD